ncbi:hypothetical protein [Streptomyces sp. NPDC102437]|uniref:hypothetical protein n=1 Tax=Streptomyces sp. NPDC102437 TaxID=3366175 RepID=UPI00381D015F
MSRKKLEKAGPPGSAARLREEMLTADRFISFMTWGVAAGMVLWSMLNATPYVRAHVSKGWEDTAFVLPLVVDLAFIGALRADEIASRYEISGGKWAAALRLFTGAASVFLNVGHAAEKSDWTGVAQHLVAPGILVLVAEAGPAYRRRLAARLTTAELEEATKQEAARKATEQEADRKRRQAQEDADRAAREEREEADRKRAQRLEDEQRERKQRQEDEQRALDLEEQREVARAARRIEDRRLDLEEKRLTATIPPAHSLTDGMPSRRTDGVPSPVATAPVRVPVPAPVPAPAGVRAAGRPSEGVSGPSMTAGPVPVREGASGAVAASAPARAQVSARVPAPGPQVEEVPAEKAGPAHDWDLPGLPDDCAPGRRPELLTDGQARARIRYGFECEWSQRRVAAFAGRSPSTVHKHMKALESE